MQHDQTLSTSVEVPADQAGERLDKALSVLMPALSRARAKALIDQEQVQIDGHTITDAALRVKQGQHLSAIILDATPPDPVAQDIPLNIVFEDEHLLVIDKQANFVVHPAAGNWDGTLVNALLHHCGDSLTGIGGVMRPGIVHRLDKDTSGLMVVAKTDQAHTGLAAQFEDRSISRTYHALVRGVPTPKSGRIEGAIGRCPSDRKKMAVVTGGGKPAITLYKVIRTFGATAALVECTLLTGRTHQIRVHLSAMGYPVIGDQVYGFGKPLGIPALDEFPRQALHAVALRFIHPITGEPRHFDSPLPDDMAALLEAATTHLEK